MLAAQRIEMYESNQNLSLRELHKPQKYIYIYILKREMEIKIT